MTRVIVVEVEGKLMGMVVDSASQVERIPIGQIDPPPVLGGFSQEFITGVGKIEDKASILAPELEIGASPRRKQIWRSNSKRLPVVAIRGRRRYWVGRNVAATT
jgi:chemotaxis signal transduction protein